MDVLLDTAPGGYVSFGDDGTIRLINGTLLDLLGYRREELVGRSLESILAVGSRIFYQTHFFPLVRLHGHAEEIFLLLRARSGEDVGVLANAIRRERDGAMVTDCVLIRVQERRKYEDALLQARRAAEQARMEAESRARALEQANDLLEAQTVELETQQDALEAQAVELERQRAAAEDANRAKSAFLAVASHELRTPLNAIGGYVQLIELGVYGPVPPAQRQALGRVAQSQSHLLRLINEILQLSRIESGRVQYAIEDVPLSELVASVMPMIEPQLASRGLTSTVRLGPDASARADREKVQQILLNLLSNAVKFTDAGGRVTVEAGGAERPGETFISVTDTGLGIPLDMQERVFEPFVQVDQTLRRNSEGTGLGLAISRDFARGMGGDLHLRSVVGQGSTFTLTLPATDDARLGTPAENRAPTVTSAP